MRAIKYFCVLSVLAICSGDLFARVMLVPSEYSSVGSAVSFLTDGDTILVSPGIYVESIVAPSVSFTLKSTARLDSAATEFVILDPTDLPDSDNLNILTLTGGRAFFEDIVFRNRAAMTAGRLASNPAGVVGDTSVREVSFRRCVFDSVNVGVAGMPVVRVDSSRFIGSLGTAIYTSRPGKVLANATWFDGATGALVHTRRGCAIHKCLFTHKGTSYMLLALGDSVIIEGCRFVGLDTLNQRAVWLRPRCGSIMRDCSFEDIVVGYNAVLQIDDSCFQQLKGWDCAFQLINNKFVNCGSWESTANQGGEMISLRCNHSERGYLAKLDSNQIDSTREILGQASGMYLDASCTVKHTFFNDVQAIGKPQVFIYDRAMQDTFYFRHNSLSQDYQGMIFWEANSTVDARDNWWGHETGPFHPQNNPTGEGAYVDDGIRFIPWLLSDPDSTSVDTNEVFVDEQSKLLPDRFSLAVSPNPFNSTLRILLDAPLHSDVNVLLYDLLGREVDVIYRGRLVSNTISYAAPAGMASGVYFLRAESLGVSAMRKVVLLR